jgi:hypothetical protein
MGDITTAHFSLCLQHRLSERERKKERKRERDFLYNDTYDITTRHPPLAFAARKHKDEILSHPFWFRLFSSDYEFPLLEGGGRGAWRRIEMDGWMEPGYGKKEPLHGGF